MIVNKDKLVKYNIERHPNNLCDYCPAPESNKHILNKHILHILLTHKYNSNLVDGYLEIPPKNSNYGSRKYPKLENKYKK